MVKRSFIVLFSVHFRLFAVPTGMAGPPAEAHSEIRERMCTIGAFLVTNWLPETGGSYLLHPPCAWRNSTPALGLGLMGAVEIALGAWKQKGNAYHTHLVISCYFLFA